MTGELYPLPFIVGVPRSGTTLLRLMLDAHRDLAIPPETWFLRRVPEASRRLGARRQLHRLVTGSPTWPDMHLDPGEYRRALRAIRPWSLADGVRAFYRLYAARQGKPRAGDKTPGYLRHLDRIERLLPEARFIHVIRDGRDVAVSLRGLPFAPAGGLETIAREWDDGITTARRLGARCAHYLEVRYEALVERPGIELRRIADFLELPWEPELERYHEQAGTRLGEIGTARSADGEIIATRAQRLGWAGRAAGPPDPSRIGRWRNELTADELATVERSAGQLLDELGYRTEATGV